MLVLTPSLDIDILNHPTRTPAPCTWMHTPTLTPPHPLDIHLPPHLDIYSHPHTPTLTHPLDTATPTHPLDRALTG